MGNEYVRICPVCDQENLPGRARCNCGASLAGVDFSLKRAPAAAPPAVVPDAGGDEGRSGIPVLDPPHPAPREDSATVAPPEAATAVAPPEAGIAVAPPEAGIAVAPPPDTGAASLICPHADCAQANPPGSVRCVYCNRLLTGASSAAANARPLPPALRGAYTVVDVFPAAGSEADILLVADARTGERRVAKLYRRGIAPDFRLLDILAQSVGDAVVRVLAHGVSDGVAYELLEYVEGGTLEDLMHAGPLPKSDLVRVVQEVADALNGIHTQHILHRDLKPENVLVRARAPLELALTDFGIASLSEATQHFTDTARTTKYAAPEALTGVLDQKSDWWSLGMIVLEAASGRHPFEGLTEPVMNYQLATRPVDVRGVYDDDLRLLCRGLLMRDPKQRWGGEEVARWLAGDATLAMPVEGGASPEGVRPYRFGKTEATSAGELALALARHWDAARRDLARGQVARWLEQELHDYNLLRTLRDIQDRKELSDDGKLLRFLLAAAPELPPVWRGSPVTQDAVLAAARAATGGDDDAQSWLDSLARDGVLAAYGAAGHEALRGLDARWREGWQRFVSYWEVVQRAEDRWRKAPRDIGSGRAVSFDDLAFVATGRLEMPPQRDVAGPLLLALHDADYVQALRDEVNAGLVQTGGHCEWFEALWESAHEEPVGVVTAYAVLPQAKEDAAAEARREKAAADAHAQAFVAARDEVRARVEALLALVPSGDEDLAPETVTRLTEGFAAFQAAAQRLLALEDPGEPHDALRRALEKLTTLGFAAQRSLAATEATRGVSAIFLQPRVALGAVAALVIVLIRVPAVLIAVGVVVALVVGYRWYSGFHATERALDRLRLFGLSARSFLRGPAAAKGDVPQG